jgi:hypothetical protein
VLHNSMRNAREGIHLHPSPGQPLDILPPETESYRSIVAVQCMLRAVAAQSCLASASAGSQTLYPATKESGKGNDAHEQFA